MTSLSSSKGIALDIHGVKSSNNAPSPHHAFNDDTIITPPTTPPPSNTTSSEEYERAIQRAVSENEYMKQINTSLLTQLQTATS